MHAPTLHRGEPPNDDPAGYGTGASDAFGFPVCTATVRYPQRGYNAMFGWVQLVRSTDNQSGGQHFEMDPFALFGDVRSPYCWYGTERTLFDAPSRQDRAPIEWIAYSFLATTPIDEVIQVTPQVPPDRLALISARAPLVDGDGRDRRLPSSVPGGVSHGEARSSGTSGNSWSASK